MAENRSPSESFEGYNRLFESYKLHALTGSPGLGLIDRPLLFVGRLNEKMLRDILTEYDQLTPIPFIDTGAERGFAWQPQPDKTKIAQLNHDHIYFEISGLFKFLIWRFVRELNFSQPKVLLDILNVRAWTTRPAAHSDFGPTEWHTDHMPISMFKIMVYLTEIGGAKGGLHVVTNESEGTYEEARGEAGTFVLFNNSMLKHRGVAPSPDSPPRKCIEITVTPLPQRVKDLPFPKVGGVNARHPFFPFYDIIGVP